MGGKALVRATTLRHSGSPMLEAHVGHVAPGRAHVRRVTLERLREVGVGQRGIDPPHITPPGVTYATLSVATGIASDM